ncbi:MAG: DUF2339 domain-containing protein [Treponema sp.]|jgi:hypothetical protein|nr:DUF2339 domain-containing protein [Treponema sp.]
MEIVGNLKDIVSRQKKIAIDLEAEYHALEDSDFIKENTLLKTEIDKIRADFEKLSGSISELAGENSSLKNALYEQIYNEKITIIDAAAKKLDIYFHSNIDGELNKLTAFENDVKSRIKTIRETLAKNAVETQDEINAKLAELSTLLDRRLTEAHANAAQAAGAFSQEEREQFEALKNEQITDEQIRAVAKKNNFERFVGLNMLNVIGIFLLVVGAIAAMRYSYMRLSDLFKGVMIFVLGGIMLTAGEILNRKKPNIFSLGISAGGIAILYVALATSYFALHILEMYPAIAVCILLTAGAFVLSTRYNSQVIASFALVGGYLPVFSIGSDDTIIYGAMVYFAALNLLALIISWNKKWRVSPFIGLVLNIAGTAYICLWFHEAGNTARMAITILYVAFAFLIYTAIPVVSTWRTGSKFQKSDVVLLAINTLFSSLIMYGVFYRFELDDYVGLLAAAFAVSYFLLGRFIDRKFAADVRHTTALFYLTGLAFVVLIIPLQFGRAWLSLGWLAEGVLLAVYGILKNEKRFKLTGFIISALCLFAFVVFDCTQMDHFLFPWKYLAITAGSLLILGAYMYKKMTNGEFVSVFKYFALANLWLYVIYVIGKAGNILSGIYRSQPIWHINYLISAASITATFLIAYVIRRIKILSSTGIKVFSIIMHIIGILWLFVINQTNTPVASIYFRTTTPELGITLAGTLVLAVLGILSVLSLMDIMKVIVNDRKLGIEWFPLVISWYFIIILTQNLITQYRLSFSSMVISIIYVLTALAWIVFGFMRRYAFIRRFGLALAILAVIKLFLIDLRNLTQGYRIVSYFALGISLIAISFVYQYFSKRLELKEGVSVHGA